jgi:FkbM family methyltransferase
MRDGRVLAYREGTADTYTLNEIFVEDEYRLGAPSTGEAAEKLSWVIDVGAHIGLFSLRIAPRADRVLSFEPHPENFALLERNLSGPAFAHVERRNVAVSDRPGTLRLFLGGKNTGGHSAYPVHASSPGTYVDVPCVSLVDELEARGVRRIDFLKVDCEGGEYRIFEGLAAWGLSRIDEIAMEYHAAPPGSPATHSGEGLERLLSDAGFRVERVPNNDPGYGVLFATRDPVASGAAVP